MQRLATLSTALLLAGAVSGQALTPAPLPCEYELDRDGFYIGWVNSSTQANGVLVFATRDEPMASAFSLEDCASGRTLRIGLNKKQINSDFEGENVVLDTLETAIQSDKSYSMKGLRNAFRKAGYKTTLKTSAAESCACSEYFPELRGSKTPYEAR